MNEIIIDKQGDGMNYQSLPHPLSPWRRGKVDEQILLIISSAGYPWYGQYLLSFDQFWPIL